MAPGGAPVGNVNGQIHGIYTKGITDEEKELAANLELLSVDGELLTQKIQYTRIWRVCLLLTDRDLSPERQEYLEKLLRLYELRVGSSSDGEGGGSDSEDTVNRMPDFEALLDRTVARIESLTKTKITVKEHIELLDDIADLEDGMDDAEGAQAEA